MDSCCTNSSEAYTVTNFALVFATGLGISLGHCIGMCGPLQTAFAMQQERGIGGSLLRYHSGRLLSYALIGGLFGLVGSVTVLSGTIQGWFSLLVGALIMISAVVLFDPRLALPGGFPGPWKRAVTGSIRSLLKSPAPGKQFFLGMGNGFLPCGPVLAMALAAAAAAHPLRGMAALFIYGLGTVPVLVVLALLSRRIPLHVRKRTQAVGAVLVLVVGVQILLRGMAGLGWIDHLVWGSVVVW